MKDTWTESHSTTTSICNCVMTQTHMRCTMCTVEPWERIIVLHAVLEMSYSLTKHQDEIRTFLKKLLNGRYVRILKEFIKKYGIQAYHFCLAVSPCCSRSLTPRLPPHTAKHARTQKSPSLDLLFQALVLSPGLRRESARV